MTALFNDQRSAKLISGQLQRVCRAKVEITYYYQLDAMDTSSANR
jgi:hypothetical protein